MLLQFSSALAGIGLLVDQVLIDNEIHRVPVQGKKGLPGWYVAKDINGKLYGSYGDWTTGEKYKFYNGESDSRSISDEDRMAMELLAAKEREEREKAQQEAAKQSFEVWEKAKPCPVDHPYLTNKGLVPMVPGLRKKPGPCLSICWIQMETIPLYSGYGTRANWTAKINLIRKFSMKVGRRVVAM